MQENSIEEDIEELKRLLYIDSLTQYGKRKLINYYEQQEKNYKRVLEENEKLNKKIEKMKSLDIYKLVEDWETGQLIPVQKIKDKIEELKEKQEDNKKYDIPDWEDYDVYKEIIYIYKNY